MRFGGRRSVAQFALMLAVLAVVSSAALASGGSVTVRDDLGVRVTVRQPVRRIVSLISSDTQILLALGLRSRIVGVDSDSRIYMPPPYLAMARHLPSVGNSYAPGPNVEVIAARRPDLVLSSAAVKGNAALRRIGLPVVVLNPQSLAGIEHDVLLVGSITGTGARASALVHRMQTVVTRYRTLASHQAHHPTVYLEVGYGPGLYTVGPGSYLDGLIKLLGGRNVMDQVSRLPYPQVDPETLIRLNPQVIILDDTPYVTPASLAKRPGFQKILAVEDHRVYANINSNLLSEPGPAVVNALPLLYRDLYGTSHAPQG